MKESSSGKSRERGRPEDFGQRHGVHPRLGQHQYKPPEVIENGRVSVEERQPDRRRNEKGDWGLGTWTKGESNLTHFVFGYTTSEGMSVEGEQTQVAYCLIIELRKFEQ